MSHLDPDTRPGATVRSWIWLMANLAFSSLILLFLFWIFSIYLILDNMRLESAAAAHILLVFETPPSPKEVLGLTATMEKVAGKGSVSSLAPPDQKSRTGRSNSRRILSVAVSLGRLPDGQTVTLAEQIRSIREIIKNDSEIKEVVFNPDWVSRVDSLAGISRGVQKGILVLGGLVCVGMAIYWGRISLSLWLHLFPGFSSRETSRPVASRSTIFQRQDENPAVVPRRAEKEKGKAATFLCVPSGGLWGIVVAFIALFLAWMFRTALYPDKQNPFVAGAMGPFPVSNHLWILIPGFCGAIGLLGGLFCYMFSFLSEEREVIQP